MNKSIILNSRPDGLTKKENFLLKTEEIQNLTNKSTKLTEKIYANQGAAQFIFLKGNEEPAITYEKRNGKYTNQIGVTLPKV